MQVALLTALVSKAAAQSDSIAFSDIPGMNEIPVGWSVVIGGIVLAWEIASHAVPSTKNWTIVGRLIKFLGKVSDWLNRKKK